MFKLLSRKTTESIKAAHELGHYGVPPVDLASTLISGEVIRRYPINGMGCCARTASGHAAAPPSEAMKSRRRISDPPQRRAYRDPARNDLLTGLAGRGEDFRNWPIPAVSPRSGRYGRYRGYYGPIWFEMVFDRWADDAFPGGSCQE
jgi:hypothetical protein